MIQGMIAIALDDMPLRGARTSIEVLGRGIIEFLLKYILV